MGINLGQAFKRTSAEPLDESTLLSKAEMLGMNDDVMPVKYYAVCKDDGKMYLYDKTATPNAETGKFSVLESGSAGGGGAVPAYIVGTNEMGADWLSETEGGTALTPVDKQEYVILTSGSWLRKHVIWMESLKAYRLTGKVAVTDELQRDVVKDSKTITQTIPNTINTQYGNKEGMDLVTGTVDGIIRTISFSVNYGQYYTYRREIGIVVDGVVVTSGVSTGTTYDRDTMPISASYTFPEGSGGKTWSIRILWSRTENQTQGDGGRSYINNGSVTIDYDEVLRDYETDDVIDITETEIDEIWASTAGSPNPENNRFSTEERLWGYWIDGKPIYRKTVDFGALPNNTTKTVNHGISNLNKVIDFTMWAFDGTYHLVLPYVSSSNFGAQTEMWVEASSIKMKTAQDRSNYSESYATLYYTKTT